MWWSTVVHIWNRQWDRSSAFPRVFSLMWWVHIAYDGDWWERGIFLVGWLVQDRCLLYVWWPLGAECIQMSAASCSCLPDPDQCGGCANECGKLWPAVLFQENLSPKLQPMRHLTERPPYNVVQYRVQQDPYHCKMALHSYPTSPSQDCKTRCFLPISTLVSFRCLHRPSWETRDSDKCL